MRSDASNKDQVQIAAGKVRDALSDPRLQDVVEQAATQVPGEADPQDKIAGLLSGDADALASSGSFARPGVPSVPRPAGQHDPEPLRGGTETRRECPTRGKPASLGSKNRQMNINASCTSRRVRSPPRTRAGSSSIAQRRARPPGHKGNAPFNPDPAEYDGVTDDARLVVVGDWGTGLPRARAVATQMGQGDRAGLASQPPGARECTSATSTTPGFEAEDRKRFLDLWPVTARPGPGPGRNLVVAQRQPRHVQRRFRLLRHAAGRARASEAQRSPDGKATSFFRLRSPS